MPETGEPVTNPVIYFRLRCKFVLLTWSQCDTDHVSVFNTIDRYLAVTKCVIARESHQDGNPHFHAYVEFEHTPDRILSNQLDINGTHPNCKPKGCKGARKAAEEYCRKGNDWINFGYDEEQEDDSDDSRPHSICEQIAKFDLWTDAIDWGFRNNVSFHYIQAAYNSRLSLPPPTYDTGDEILGTIRSDTLRFMQYDASASRALILEGPTGCGKTTWAKRNMPRPSLFVSHIDDLKHLRPGYHVSIIFDDMSFTGDEGGRGAWPITSQIHLVDFENQRSIHCRYINTVIPAGIHKCFTCNVGRYPLAHDAAIQRRVYHVLC